MTDKQQTAVEWLIEAAESQKITIVYSDKIEFVAFPLAIINQAKQMEKEQIIDAYTMGSYDTAEKEFRPEQYYNETYEKTNNIDFTGSSPVLTTNAENTSANLRK